MNTPYQKAQNNVRETLESFEGSLCRQDAIDLAVSTIGWGHYQLTPDQEKTIVTVEVERWGENWGESK